MLTFMGAAGQWDWMEPEHSPSNTRCVTLTPNPTWPWGNLPVLAQWDIGLERSLGLPKGEEGQRWTREKEVLSNWYCGIDAPENVN